MIQEDYVSFEMAKLLKEKGFPIGEFHKGLIGTFKGIAVSKITKEMIEKEMLSCIPQSVVMKWLREVHNLFIAVEFGWFHGDYEYQASVKKMNPTIPPTLDSIVCIKAFRNKSYEIACEKAIKYCLVKNLI